MRPAGSNEGAHLCSTFCAFIPFPKKKKAAPKKKKAAPKRKVAKKKAAPKKKAAAKDDAE